MTLVGLLFLAAYAYVFFDVVKVNIEQRNQRRGE